MTRAAFLVGALLLFGQPASSQTIPSNKTLYFLGPGSGASCGKWTQERAGKTVGAEALAIWALGFLTATGIMVDHLNPLAGVDSDAVLTWIDNHCRANPLDPFGVALIAFAHARRR